MEFQQYSDGMHLAAAYVKNALGDVVGTYDVMSGVTLYREYCYDAYGNPVEEYDNTNVMPPNENPFRYRGEYYDTETGFYYLRNRYYDPKAGRFITEDPIRDGTNWYTYCNGNPIRYKDPTGLIAEGDSNLPPEIQIILNGTNKDGNGGLSLAWKLANERGDTYAMSRISEEANQIREFSATNINRVMPLVQSTAALGAGHTATLLINENDQGLLLSYWSENETATGPGEMRISMLSSSEWNAALDDGGQVNFVGSNGKTSSETYNGSLYLTVSHGNGRNALGKMANLFNNPGEYNLATNNCDHKTAAIVTAADKFYDKRVLPNDSFTYTTMYHTNYWAWVLNQALQSNGGY